MNSWLAAILGVGAGLGVGYFVFKPAASSTAAGIAGLGDILTAIQQSGSSRTLTPAQVSLVQAVNDAPANWQRVATPAWMQQSVAYYRNAGLQGGRLLLPINPQLPQLTGSNEYTFVMNRALANRFARDVAARNAALTAAYQAGVTDRARTLNTATRKA